MLAVSLVCHSSGSMWGDNFNGTGRDFTTIAWGVSTGSWVSRVCDMGFSSSFWRNNNQGTSWNVATFSVCSRCWVSTVFWTSHSGGFLWRNNRKSACLEQFTVGWCVSSGLWVFAVRAVGGGGGKNWRRNTFVVVVKFHLMNMVKMCHLLARWVCVGHSQGQGSVPIESDDLDGISVSSYQVC